jgi:hypothetical protein
MQVFHGLERGLPSKRAIRGRLAGFVAIATLLAFLVVPAAPAAATPSSPIVLIVMENTSYSKIVGSASAPFINDTMIQGGFSFTNYFDNTDGSLHNYLAMTDGNISTNQAPPLENIFHQLQSSSTSWKTYEESMPSACYTGAESGTVPGSTDGLYVKIHNPAMYFNNITGDPSACAKVVPLTTGPGGTFDPNNLPAFSYVVPNNCNNMHTQSTGTCPAYFGTNPHADKITMADNWLANFVPTIASKATVILTWDEGSFSSPQQITTLEFGQGVSSGTNNGSFNHFNLLAGLETAFGVPLIAGAIGKTPLPIGSTPPPLPTITSFSPPSGPVGTSVTINGTGFTGASDVKFHGTSVGAGNFTVNSDVKITATVPGGASNGLITVVGLGGSANSATAFTVTSGPLPTITSFTPTSGPVGTLVTVNGTNFTASAVVKFNGVTGTGFIFKSATKVKANVPTGASTGPISVTTASGTGTSATNFTVPSGSPTITSFTPPSGPVGTLVTINGTTFTGATVVKFNGVIATSFTVVSDIKITATVPAGATTGKIIVKTPAGNATSLTNFTVT